jgi:hypothetical protein
MSYFRTTWHPDERNAKARKTYMVGFKTLKKFRIMENTEVYLTGCIAVLFEFR